jgi:heme-degrading monooxygenase HmoA
MNPSEGASEPRRDFLLAFAALFSAASLSGAQAGRTFLQLTRYDRMPEKFFKPYFDAVDRHYSPGLSKAAGLLLYQRFRHYDLPERISIQLWESEQAAKAWHDAEPAKTLWQRAVREMPKGISPEYLQPMHSFAHYHYILEESFKS